VANCQPFARPKLALVRNPQNLRVSVTIVVSLGDLAKTLPIGRAR
jgi:hypothetical protein